MGEITVNNRPLLDYLLRAEAIERRAEAESVRQEEIRQHKRYTPVITRRILLWMPPKRREKVDPVEFEKLVRMVGHAVRESNGITYDGIRKIVGQQWKNDVLAKVVEEIGAVRYRSAMQGPVLIATKLPPGRKVVGGPGYKRRKKMATPEQLAAALAKQAGVPLPPPMAVLPPPAPTMHIRPLRRTLIEMAALMADDCGKQRDKWIQMKRHLEETAPKQRGNGSGV